MQTSVIGSNTSQQEAVRSKSVLSPEQYWKNRLSLLPREKQEYIAKKYYGGKYPWKG